MQDCIALFRRNLTKMKKQFLIAQIGTIAMPVAILFLWEISVSLGLVRSVILPAPSEIGATLLSLLCTGELWQNLFVSIVRVAEGFAIGMTFGVLLGIQTVLSLPMHPYLTKETVEMIVRKIKSLVLIARKG